MNFSFYYKSLSIGFKWLPWLIIPIANSCMPKPLDLDVQPASAKLVISSQVISNNIIGVSVSRSFSALEGSGTPSEDKIKNLLVENAEVIISNGESKYVLQAAAGVPGFYFSSTIPLTEGHVYNLSVKDHATQQGVQAQSTLLPRVEMDSVYFSTQRLFDDTLVSVHLSFEDPQGVENWYVLSFSGLNRDTSKTPRDVSPSLLNLNSQSKRGYILLSDKSFGGTTYSGKHLLPAISLGDTVGFLFSNITEGYYKFLSANSSASGNTLGSVLNEPFNYPTNVQGGYGYFSTYRSNIFIEVIAAK
ncbi:MAG TPA: DUF4249 domain-containing protein [Cytophagaceae bacterium]|jgi:hypothetical protein